MAEEPAGIDEVFVYLYAFYKSVDQAELQIKHNIDADYG